MAASVQIEVDDRGTVRRRLIGETPDERQRALALFVHLTAGIAALRAGARVWRALDELGPTTAPERSGA